MEWTKRELQELCSIPSSRSCRNSRVFAPATHPVAPFRAAGAANRLTEDDRFTYGYDANGNLAAKTEKLSGLVTRYSWDAQNQLVRIDLPDGGVAQYRYDVFGRRIEKNVDGTVSRYVYDGDDVLLEYDGSNALVARFTHGPAVDQPLVMERTVQIDPADGGGTGTVSYYYHADHEGPIRALTD